MLLLDALPVNRLCLCLIQTAADSAGVLALTGCRLWVRESWCFCWSVCQKKKLFQKTSSHSISTFTKKPKKVDGTHKNRPCEFLFTGKTNGYRIALFCYREVLGGVG